MSSNEQTVRRMWLEAFEDRTRQGGVAHLRGTGFARSWQVAQASPTARRHSWWPCSDNSSKAHGSTVDGETIYRLVMSVQALSRPAADVATAFLCEAIQNVIQHSRVGAAEGEPPEWRAHAAFDAETSSVLFSVMDDGVGIPMSAPRRDPMTFCGDTELVAQAVAASRARGRGNGFANMINWVDQYPGSELVVRSLAGACAYRGAGLQLLDEGEFLHGTAVSLTLALRDAEREA